MKPPAMLQVVFLAAAAAGLRAQSGSETRLSPFEVAAQGYLVGDAPDATMTKLAVFETPGAAADIDRALQLLPAVAFVDEGDALYVRGGSARETTMFVDGIPLPFADRAMAPVGTPATALSPYYVQRASLYAGDVPVRFFATLSGAVDVEAAHAARGTSGLLDAGLGSVTVLLQSASQSGAGFVLAGSALDTTATYRLNPSPREFTEYPRGAEGFASCETAIGDDTTVDIVGFDQDRRMGFVEDDPSYVGPFVQDARTGFVVGRVKAAQTDGSGWQLAVGGGRDAVSQNFGNLDYASRQQLAAFVADRSWALPGGTLVGVGADLLRDSGGLTGAVPAGPSLAPAAPTTAIDYGRRIGQGGVFASANWTISPRLQAVTGVRVDLFGEPAATEFEPRASVSFQAAPRVSITADAGRIAQAATSVESASTPDALPPTRMGEVSLSAVGRLASCRFTLGGYVKRYNDLIQYTRTYQAIGGGMGAARGLDLGVETKRSARLGAGLAYSLGHSYRTDPNTGTLASSPFDVRDTLAATTRARLGYWRLAAAFRFATGRPFTPILGGQYNAAGSAWAPVYGAPDAARLPDLRRFDVSASRAIPERSGVVVPYLSITNLFNRANVYAYTYSSDYSTQIPEPSLYPRTVYAGCSILFSP